MPQKKSTTSKKPVARKSLPKKKQPTKLQRLFNGRSGRIVVTLGVIMGAFGGFGLWQLNDSNASFRTTYEQCFLLGRTFNDSYSNNCRDYCRSGAGTMVSSSSYNYCSKAVSKTISSAKCDSLKRDTVLGGGCARRWEQTSYTGARQCKDNTARYVVASYDYCTGGSTSDGGTTNNTTAWAWPVTPNIGVGDYGSGHYARDFRAENGRKVLAVANGTVSHKGYISYGCGNGLILKVVQNGVTLYPTYEHIKFASGINEGTKVSKGQLLGYITSPPAGKNDCWTGYHLHLGIQKQGGYVESHRSDSTAHPDPCKYISGCS